MDIATLTVTEKQKEDDEAAPPSYFFFLRQIYWPCVQYLDKEEKKKSCDVKVRQVVSYWCVCSGVISCN